MLHIERVYPADPAFPSVRRFVNEVYAERLEVENPARPDVFAALMNDETPVACAGIFLARTHRPLFFERLFARDILAEIAGPDNENTVAELGALAVRLPEDALGHRTMEIAAAMNIIALDAAIDEGVKHVVFVGDRMLSRFSRMLSIPFENHGRVTPDGIDEPEFRERLSRYFSVGRNAYSADPTPARQRMQDLLPRIAASIGASIAPSAARAA